MDAHGYGKRFIVRTEEILSAFLELESQLIRTRRNVGRRPTFFYWQSVGIFGSLALALSPLGVSPKSST